MTAFRYINRPFLKVVLLLVFKKVLFSAYDKLFRFEQHQVFIEFQVA